MERAYKVSEVTTYHYEDSEGKVYIIEEIYNNDIEIGTMAPDDVVVKNSEGGTVGPEETERVLHGGDGNFGFYERLEISR